MERPRVERKDRDSTVQSLQLHAGLFGDCHELGESAMISYIISAFKDTREIPRNASSLC